MEVESGGGGGDGDGSDNNSNNNNSTYNYSDTNGDNIDGEEKTTFDVDKTQLKLSAFKGEGLAIQELLNDGALLDRFFDKICAACKNEIRYVKLYVLGGVEWIDSGVGFISYFVDPVQ